MAKLVAMCLAVASSLAACGGQEQPAAPAPQGDVGAVHVHGLGVNPSDRSLYLATHTGLFRLAEDASDAVRVGDERQDTMGFTVVGPDRFLGSGHPDPRSDLPPFLGLIESGDAGKSWKPVSLLGDVDFHVLEALGESVYGFGSDWKSRAPVFLASSDGGERWQKRAVPEPLVSLAIDPADPEHIVASGERQSFASPDAGRTWRPLVADAGLLAWTESGGLHMIRFDGSSAVSDDAGATWTETAPVGGAPAAFEGAGDELYAALHDGSIRVSSDGGRTWPARTAP